MDCRIIVLGLYKCARLYRSCQYRIDVPLSAAGGEAFEFVSAHIHTTIFLRADTGLAPRSILLLLVLSADVRGWLELEHLSLLDLDGDERKVAESAFDVGLLLRVVLL